jgi:exosortase
MGMQIKKIIRNWLPGYLMVAALIVVLYLPIFVWLVQSWLGDPNYSHGFLILPVAAFIAWTKRKELVRGKPHLAGVIVLAAGLATYVAGFAWRMHWLWASSLLVVAFGLVLYLWGTKTARSMMLPICFLIFMIPLPFLDSMSIPLQSVAASGSASVVQAIGIPAAQTGAEIQLLGAAFTIGTPCSGMNTLISLLASATFLLYFVKARFYSKVSLFLLVFPIAILANIFRIALLLVIAHFWGNDVAMTFFHGFSSLLLFVLAFSLLILFAKVLRCKFKSLAELTSG